MAYEVKQTTKQPKFSVAIQSDAYKRMITNTLGDPKVALEFIANISAVVSANPQLQQCDAGSIISAGFVASSLKLPLNQTLGFAYVIGYNDHKTGTKKAQFQIGYKGLIQLALRTGQYQKIGCKAVHKGEVQGQDEFGDEIIKFDHKYDNEEVVGYYAYFKLLNGAIMTSYKTKEECEKHGRKWSKSYDKLWTSDFDAMAMKTTLKLLLSKYGILSTEIQMALKYDQAVINKTENGETIDYIDNPKSSGPIVETVVKEEDDYDPFATDEDATKLQEKIDSLKE